EDTHRSPRVLATPRPGPRDVDHADPSPWAPGAARVALVHDWLTGMRGGERCLEVLCELFPEAPLFTLLHVPGSTTPVIERRRIVTSFVQRLPRAAERYRHALPLFPLAARRFDLTGYDLIVSMSHCVAKGVRVPPGALPGRRGRGRLLPRRLGAFALQARGPRGRGGQPARAAPARRRNRARGRAPAGPRGADRELPRLAARRRGRRALRALPRAPVPG